MQSFIAKNDSRHNLEQCILRRNQRSFRLSADILSASLLAYDN